MCACSSGLASSGPRATHASSSGPHETHAPARSRRRALSLAHAVLPHGGRRRAARGRDDAALHERDCGARWHPLTRARLRGVWASERLLGSCAVVGSSAALLTRRLGAEIDAHDVVIRANQALVRGLEAHVGKRTDLRVWGFVPLPREKRYSHAEWAAEDNYIIYCPPIKWAGYCWNQIAVDADPRFHPSAWRRAQQLIHTNRTRCAHVGCYPSTGAMAVLHAVDRCQRVTVYGFGTNEAGVAPCERPSAECPGVEAARPLGGVPRRAHLRGGHALPEVHAAARRAVSGLAARARALPEGRRRRPCHPHEPRQGRLHQYHGKADYFAEAAAHHDVVQEWAWLERLQRRGALVWRGQPGVAPESDGHRHRMEP